MFGLYLHLVHQFADFTIGKAWTADYGDPHVPEDFDFIYPISPLHNIPDQEFPPTILLTADRKFSHSWIQFVLCLNYLQ